MIFTYTQESKIIDSLVAYKVIVSFKKSTKTPYEIWYTKDLHIKNVNNNNPYKKIDGVLLDYKISIKGISMHYICKSFSTETDNSNVFIIPNSFEKIPIKKLNSIIDKTLHLE